MSGGAKAMAGALLRAAGAAAVVAWAVATATFLLMRAVPGGPLSRERRLPEQVRAAIEAHYHLDDPLWRQYVRYLGEALAGRFGPSYDDPGRMVGEIIAERLPVSAALGAAAMVLALLAALPLGIAAALWPGRWPDRLNALAAAAGVSVPSFILGSVLLWLFSLQLGWFPAGWGGGWRSAVLPAAALALLPTAYMARLLRSELSEALRSDFILTARAKGLHPARVVLVHALRLTPGPLLAYSGPQTAGIMTGSFVIERIFNIPGLGQYFVVSIANRNYPLIMGVTLCYTVLLVAMNLLCDAVARGLDPRARRA